MFSLMRSLSQIWKATVTTKTLQVFFFPVTYILSIKTPYTDVRTLRRLKSYIYIYISRTAQLTSRRCILYIYSTNIRTEYLKHAAHSPCFSLQNAVCFIMLRFLVLVLFTFYIQDVLKFLNKFGRISLSQIWKATVTTKAVQIFFFQQRTYYR